VKRNNKWEHPCPPHTLLYSVSVDCPVKGCCWGVSKRAGSADLPSIKPELSKHWLEVHDGKGPYDDPEKIAPSVEFSGMAEVARDLLKIEERLR
jgi:hypothetical protein